MLAPRSLKDIVVAALLGSAAFSALGQSYPTRPVRLIVAFSPGGGNDIIARIVAQKLTEVIGQSVIVDNRAGAGGNLAAEIVANATPDGHTLLNISTAHAIAQSLYTKLNYDLVRDLAPVVVLGTSPLVMTVNPGVPAQSVADLVAWSKKNRLLFASGGIGVISHLSMEMFKHSAGIDATHIAYKGGVPAAVDAASGQVQVTTNTMPTLLPYIKGGRLRALGVMTEKRHAALPAVPTLVEQGYKEFVLGNWTGIVVPAATPKPLIGKLASQMTKIVQSAEIAGRLSTQGFDPLGGSPEEFGALIRSDISRYAKTIKAAGIKSEGDSAVRR